MSRIVADEHVRIEKGMRLQQLVGAAIAYGWRDAAKLYHLEDQPDLLRDVLWFVDDLLGGARGPFAPLLLAIADANSKHFNVTEDRNVDIDEDGFPDWWRLKETADPVVHALAYALACMHDPVTADEWEENR